MPLSKKQRAGMPEGYARCLACGEKVQRLRQMGVPNEALEERQQAVQKMYEQAKEVIDQFDAERKGDK